MPLLTLGINHHTAPLALRERLAFGAEQLEPALLELRAQLQQDGAPPVEATIVSTCNRTEITCVASHQDLAARLIGWLAAQRAVDPDELDAHLYRLPDDQAVRHAFRVASGLDSMVLGETQILGQIKDAVRTADAAGALGTYLNQLFQRSFAVAKEVRAQTEIGAHSVSMAAAAVRLAQRIFDSIANQRVLFIGAGEMIELCATHFAAQRPRFVAVANRTVARGQQLADALAEQGLNTAALPLSGLPDRLAGFDIIVSCTASTLPLIGLGMVERAIRNRRHRPMFIVDLAVPRDVEAEVGRLDDVFLYTVDDLGEIVRDGQAQRQAAVQQAETIIEARVQHFMHWLDTRSTVPLIQALQQHGEQLQTAELERARHALARGEAPEAALEALAHGLTKKFLHGPMHALRHASDADREALIRLLPELFGRHGR